MSRKVPGFTRVGATTEELSEWKRKHDGRYPSVYRLRCDACGRQIWGSGFGIGSHRRVCDEIEARRALGVGPVVSGLPALPNPNPSIHGHVNDRVQLARGVTVEAESWTKEW